MDLLVAQEHAREQALHVAFAEGVGLAREVVGQVIEKGSHRVFLDAGGHRVDGGAKFALGVGAGAGGYGQEQGEKEDADHEDGW